MSSWVWIENFRVVKTEIENSDGSMPDLVGLHVRKLQNAIGGNWTHNAKRDWIYGHGNGVLCFEPVAAESPAAKVASV